MLDIVNPPGFVKHYYTNLLLLRPLFTALWSLFAAIMRSVSQRGKPRWEKSPVKGRNRHRLD